MSVAVLTVRGPGPLLVRVNVTGLYDVDHWALPGLRFAEGSGVAVGVKVAVGVSVAVGVWVGVWVDVGARVGVSVGGNVGVKVGV